MTDEQRELLTRDLCGRLPHKCKIMFRNPLDTSKTLTEELRDVEFRGEIGTLVSTSKWFNLKIDTVKPYLRPMDSMNDSEEEIFYGLVGEGNGLSVDAIDYLNSHYFDYRGLIEMGLAVEAPAGLYNE